MVEEQKEKKSSNLTSVILVVLLVVASFLAGLSWTKIREEKEPKKEEKQVVQISPAPQEPAVLGEELETTIGNFLVTKDEICQENGKPIVYFFGEDWCPHCTWEHPIFTKVMAKFGNLISFHDNMDKPETDNEVKTKYGGTGVPFLVLGCRYVRPGSGERAGEVQEEKNLTALICKLTDGQPEKVCAD